MLRSTPSKRGRPQAEYRARDGTKIVGLSKQADGRWRISETGEVFFEPDELLAIARFEATISALRGRNEIKLQLPPQNSLDEAMETIAEAGGTRLHMQIKPEHEPVEYSMAIGNNVFWAEVRRLLIYEPKFVALRTGVEWVGFGAELPRPSPSPTMDELIEVYRRMNRIWKAHHRAAIFERFAELPARFLRCEPPS